MKAGEKRNEEGLKSEIEKIAQFLKQEKQAMDKKSLQVENQLREVRVGEQKLQQAYAMLLDIIEANSSTPGSKDELLSALRKELPNKFEIFSSKTSGALIGEGKENKHSIRDAPSKRAQDSTPLFGHNHEKKALQDSRKRDPLSIIERLHSNLKPATPKHPTPKQRSQRTKLGQIQAPLPKAPASHPLATSKSRVKLNTSSSQEKLATKFDTSGLSYTKSNLGSPKTQIRKLKQLDLTRTVSPALSNARETVDKIFTRLIRTKRENSQDCLKPADSSAENFITISDPDALFVRSSLEKSRCRLLSPCRNPDARAQPSQAYSTSRGEFLGRDQRNKSQLLEKPRAAQKININLSSLGGQVPSIEILSTQDQCLHIKLQKQAGLASKQLSERSPPTASIFTPKKAGAKLGASHCSVADHGYFFNDANQNLSSNPDQSSSRNPSNSKKLPGFNAYFESHQDIYASAERRQTLQNSKTRPRTHEPSDELNFYKDFGKAETGDASQFSRQANRKPAEEKPKDLQTAPSTGKLTRDESRERMSATGAMSCSNTGRLSQRTVLKNPLSSVEKRKHEEPTARELARKCSAGDLQLIEQVQSQINSRFQTIEDRLSFMGHTKE